MRLNSELFSFLPDELLLSLDKIGIKTAPDLLFSGSVFDIFQRLPVGTITLASLKIYITRVTETCSAPGISGSSLLASSSRPPNRFLTDDPVYNLLRAFGDNRIIEISGDTGSGKTTLALNAVLRHLNDSGNNRALWIDTSGDFSAARTTNLLEALGAKDSDVLDRLQLALAFEIDSVYELLEEVNNAFKSPLSRPINVLVIDTITPLLGPLLSAISAQGHAVMTMFMRQLRVLCKNHSISVIVINNTASVGPIAHHSVVTARKPALGPSFAHMTDVTIWLSLSKAPSDDDNDDADDRQYPRHVFEPSGRKSFFKILDGVVVDVADLVPTSQPEPG